MERKSAIWISLAALNGFVATALFASASHFLKPRFAEGDDAIFALGAEFHLIHAVVLLVIAGMIDAGIKFSTFAAGMMQFGILIFSGSLYYRALMGAGSLGDFHWITPVGGASLMLAWLVLVVAGVTEYLGDDNDGQLQA